MGLIDIINARKNNEAKINPKPRRMIDRVYKVTVTNEDGTIETYTIGHNSVLRWRRWFRVNQPTSKVVIEETFTSVSSNGRDYTKLTFDSLPTLKHAEHGTYTHSNIQPKDNIQQTIDWNSHSDVAPAILSNKPKLTASEVTAKARAERAYNLKLTRHNGKPQIDNKIRVYLNETGKLILSTYYAEDVAHFMINNRLDFSKITIYLPIKLYNELMKEMERNED